MKPIKRKIYLSALMLLLFAACHDNESVTPVADASSEFVAGKLASVLVAEDYEVSFWEIAPGNIAVFKYRSVDADMMASKELKETLRMTNRLQMYKKLTGAAADPESIKRIEAAQKRLANPQFRSFAIKLNPITLTSSLQNKTVGENERSQGICKPQKGGEKYFFDNYVKNNPDVFDHETVGNFSETISWYPNLILNLIVLNGQKLNSGERIRVEFTGLFSFTIDAWHIADCNLGAGAEGQFDVFFEDITLNCLTNYIAYETFPV